MLAKITQPHKFAFIKIIGIGIAKIHPIISKFLRPKEFANFPKAKFVRAFVIPNATINVSIADLEERLKFSDAN